MKSLTELVGKIRSGLVPTGSTVPDGYVVRGWYENGHTYALVAFPAPYVLVVATTDDRLLRASRFVGRNYLLTDARELIEATERLTQVYENARPAGAEGLDMLFRMYGATLKERVETLRLTRGLVSGRDELCKRVRFVLRKLGRDAEEVDSVIEKFRSMHDEKTCWAVMSLGINYDPGVPNPAYVPALRIHVRPRPDGTYRYIVDIGPFPEAIVAKKKIVYVPFWAARTGVAFSRYLVMRDRAVRRKYGIGWRLPTVLMSAYTQYGWGSIFYALPGEYWGKDPNGAALLPIDTGAARVNPTSGRLCIYVPDEEYDHLLGTPSWDGGDVFRPDGWDPRKDQLYCDADRFFLGIGLSEVGVSPYDGAKRREPYADEALSAIALAYGGEDTDPQKLRAVLYEDRLLAILGGAL